ncbi:MAG: asparagine synthase (glutamine-hydrolyzing) [Lentisphaerae bacterium]|nr:asparagine synthase (glutamine-hydrolyzing) [Lentisphaerota bacterium]
MCGIVGIYNTSCAEADLQQVRAMSEVLICRGPDAQRQRRLGRAVFGHCRLSIIDLSSAADQPMYDGQERCMISFNGEIYNYRQLRSQLSAQGYNFVTNSDTEVILALYLTGGSDALKLLDGMFAFGLYDQRSDELILMRDMLGKKPLYYFSTSQRQLVFASTLPALKRHRQWQGELDVQAISDFLSYSAIPGNNSAYMHVKKVQPGSIMRFNAAGECFTEKYWQVDYRNKSDLSFDDAAAILREKLDSAVKKRLVADVPCGVFLSGGIDSAIISMLAAENSAEAINAYTVGFDEKRYDERNLAACSAEFINRRTGGKLLHCTHKVDCSSFEELSSLAEVCGEPFADFSLLPYSFLCCFAAGSNKVVLSGDGADEIFGGYERYYAMRCCALANKILPPAVLRCLADCAGMIFPDHGKRSFRSRLRRLLSLAATPESERYCQLMMQISETQKQQLYGSRILDLAPQPGQRILQQALKQVTTLQWQEKYAECDMGNYLIDDILVKADRGSMKHSLEVRSPFLDRELIEFAATLPFEYKQKGAQRKRILKYAMQDKLAGEIICQRKRGFAVPIGSWFRNEWREVLRTSLLEGKLVKDNWMNPHALQRLLAEHDSLRKDHSELLGNLLMLELFLEKAN